jgi:hypothetical protein
MPSGLNLVAATLKADTPQGEAKYYVYVMNKIVSGKGNEYVEQQTKRCVCFDRLLTFPVITEFFSLNLLFISALSFFVCDNTLKPM